MPELSVSEISNRLSQQAERVASMLLPGGKVIAGEWCAGDLSGGEGESLKVQLTGAHAGCWKDWADESVHGDLIDLWREVKGLTRAGAVVAAKEFLGIVSDIYRPSEKTYSAAPKREAIKPLSEGGKALKFLTDKRKISQKIINRFRVEGDDEFKAIVFPCYSPSDELVNRSYRTLEKKVWQDKGCAPCLFGWHALSDEAYRTRTVLLCEGQIDCMTWTQWGIHALSIPNGTGQKWIEQEWENLAVFDHIYVSFDMDGAGVENAQKTIHRLGRHRCLIVKLPHKDANDCLLSGCGPDDAREWVKSAKPPTLHGLVRANDLRARIVEDSRPKPESFTLPFLRIGPELGYFARPGEVTIWTGTTGNGKSTFLNFIKLAAISKGIGVFSANFETKVERDIRKMMTSFFTHPPSEREIDEFLDIAGHALTCSDTVGYIKREVLLEQMMFAFRRYNCSQFFVDSLMRIEGLEEDYPAQGQFINYLQEFVKSTGTHVHLVCHPRKLGENDKPTKLDVKGSSLIPNGTDNLLSICRNTEKDRMRRDNELSAVKAATMYDTEIRVEKQRETGWEGRFLLRFDPNNFAYSAFSIAPEPPPERRLKDS